MKIGIITFHRAINYGAVLQSYALQKTLIQLGADAEIIDYRCEYLENNYQIGLRLKAARGIKSFIAVLIKWAIPALMKRIVFHRWIRKKLKMSCCYRQDIADSCEKYDAFIAGSDQIWNYNHTNFDRTYFLDFVQEDSRKHSYAASFGFASIDESILSFYKPLLLKFASASVRESSGAELFRKITGGKEAQIMVDPVFLLQPNDWGLSKLGKKKGYVLIYELMPSNKIVEFALELAQKNDLKVVRIASTLQKTIHKRMKNVYGVSPQGFLDYIYNASYVVTNSFHGTAFSICFQKQFYVHRLTDEMASLNSRLDDLLTLCRLENRVVNDLRNYDSEMIDYVPIHRLLQTEREKGIRYLKGQVLKIMN